MADVKRQKVPIFFSEQYENYANPSEFTFYNYRESYSHMQSVNNVQS